MILIDSDDDKVMGHAISYSMNITRDFALKHQTVQIEIVANGSGIKLFRADTSPLKQPWLFYVKLFQTLCSACATRLGRLPSKGRPRYHSDARRGASPVPDRTSYRTARGRLELRSWIALSSESVRLSSVCSPRDPCIDDCLWCVAVFFTACTFRRTRPPTGSPNSAISVHNHCTATTVAKNHVDRSQRSPSSNNDPRGQDTSVEYLGDVVRDACRVDFAIAGAILWVERKFGGGRGRFNRYGKSTKNPRFPS